MRGLWNTKKFIWRELDTLIKVLESDRPNFCRNQKLWEIAFFTLRNRVRMFKSARNASRETHEVPSYNLDMPCSATWASGRAAYKWMVVGSETSANLQRNPVSPQKSNFGQSVSKNSPHASMKTLLGVTASFATFVMGALWNMKKFIWGDLHTLIKIFESDRPNFSRNLKLRGIAFLTM